MADPTLKDVLKAIAEMRGEMNGMRSEMNGMRSEMNGMRSEMATKADLAKLDTKVDNLEAKVDAHRAETRKGFADLDEELTGHMSVHAALEKDIQLLKGRPPRTAAAARAPRRRTR